MSITYRTLSTIETQRIVETLMTYMNNIQQTIIDIILTDIKQPSTLRKYKIENKKKRLFGGQ